MNRRNFLSTLIGGVAATAAVRTFPFRVFSFPKEIVRSAYPGRLCVPNDPTGEWHGLHRAPLPDRPVGVALYSCLMGGEPRFIKILTEAECEAWGVPGYTPPAISIRIARPRGH
jgi:hypothetical protein